MLIKHGGEGGGEGGVREGGRITSLFAVFCVFKCPWLFDKYCLMMVRCLLRRECWWFMTSQGTDHLNTCLSIDSWSVRQVLSCFFLIDNLTFDVVQFIKYVRQAYEMSVSKKRLHTNERCFILLLETNNASIWCYKRTTLPFGVTSEQRF